MWLVCQWYAINEHIELLNENIEIETALTKPIFLFVCFCLFLSFSTVSPVLSMDKQQFDRSKADQMYTTNFYIYIYVVHCIMR